MPNFFSVGLANPNLNAKILNPSLHSTTRRLYLVPAVFSLGTVVRELAITSAALINLILIPYFDGTFTVCALIGLNSISFAVPCSAKIDIV